MLAALSSPALTSVRVDYAEFGAAAAAALLARIDGEEPPTYQPSRPDSRGAGFDRGAWEGRLNDDS